MRRLSTYITALGVAAGLALTTLTPASAQTWNNGWNNGWTNNGWSGRPMVSAQVGLNSGYYGSGYVNGGPLVGAPVAGRGDGGFYGPGAFGSCVYDEGYGRTLPCDYNGGGR